MHYKDHFNIATIRQFLLDSAACSRVKHSIKVPWIRFPGLLGRSPVHEDRGLGPFGARVPVAAGRDDVIVGVRVLHGGDQQRVPEHLRVREVFFTSKSCDGRLTPMQNS